MLLVCLVILLVRRLSSQRGNQAKRRGQKHQNRTAFKLEKYGTNEKTKAVKAVSTGGLCQRCADKIEWRKKYGKYKPLTVPARCLKCKEKNIRVAYHTICKKCASSLRCCEKCGEVSDVKPRALTEEELRNKQAEEARALAGMNERQRRSYWRQKEREAAGSDGEDDDDGEGDDQGDDSNDSDGGGQGGGDRDADIVKSETPDGLPRGSGSAGAGAAEAGGTRKAKPKEHYAWSSDDDDDDDEEGEVDDDDEEEEEEEEEARPSAAEVALAEEGWRRKGGHGNGGGDEEEEGEEES